MLRYVRWHSGGALLNLPIRESLNTTITIKPSRISHSSKLSLSSYYSFPRLLLSCTSSTLSPSAMASTQTTTSPPVAKKVKHEMEMFGDVRNDNYYWLRDDSRSNPEVLSYLHQENSYTDFVMSGIDLIYLYLRRVYSF